MTFGIVNLAPIYKMDVSIWRSKESPVLWDFIHGGTHGPVGVLEGDLNILVDKPHYSDTHHH